MFHFLRGIALVAAMMLGCGAVLADPDRTSANYVMSGCRTYVGNGASAETDLPLMVGMAMDMAKCGGLIEGLSYAAPICKPNYVTNDQMVRVVVKYIDDRPARMHEDFMLLALEALRAAWPGKN